MKKNKGFVNHGTVAANNIAVGDNATIRSTDQTLTFSKNDIAELSKLLDTLIAGLQTSELPIGKKNDLIASANTFKKELKKKQPNKLAIGGILKALLENLKYVKDLVPIGTAIWEKASMFL